MSVKGPKQSGDSHCWAGVGCSSLTSQTLICSLSFIILQLLRQSLILAFEAFCLLAWI